MQYEQRHLLYHAGERNTLLKDQIVFFQSIVMITSEDLDFKFMVPLMYILNILSGTMLEFLIELLYQSISNTMASIKNQLIEAWWNLLSEEQTQESKIFFARLGGEGLFDGGDIDKSCLQYIYMYMIRSHFHYFVVIHNTYRIQQQRLIVYSLPTG